MNSFIRYFLFTAIFILVGLLFMSRIKNNISGRTEGENIGEGAQKLEQALKFIEQNYIKDPNDSELVDNAIKGMLEGLDPHSIYLPAKDMEHIGEQMEGRFEGIGVFFDLLDDTIYVEGVVPGGPSDEAGIQAGDRIVEVEGKTVAGISITTDGVLNQLKGPEGSQVEVKVVRPSESDKLPFTITRGELPYNSITFSYMITPQTGYIKIERFSETTYLEFRRNLRQLLEQKMENLILDLRGNRGGYLDMANKIADEFLADGKKIVTTKGRISQSRQSHEATGAINAFEEGALIILIDYDSASASEILAGAVQDHDRGLIVGVRSFGKGLVQLPMEFSDGSAIRIVISEYYTPSGRSIQKPYDVGRDNYAHEIADRFASGEIFDASKIQYPDSLQYQTSSGRTVYGGGGIIPDVFVADDTVGTGGYFLDLRRKDVFRKFASRYVDSHPDLKERYKESLQFVEDFDITPTLRNAFFAYASDRGVPYVETGFQRSQTWIEGNMKAYIGRRLFMDEGFYPVSHTMDRVIQEAISLIPTAAMLEEKGMFELATNGK